MGIPDRWHPQPRAASARGEDPPASPPRCTATCWLSTIPVTSGTSARVWHPCLSPPCSWRMDPCWERCTAQEQLGRRADREAGEELVEMISLR